MDFRTQITLTPLTTSFPLNGSTLFIGSCFSENIGAKFSEQALPTLINPFGILYNPLSIHNCLSRIIQKSSYSVKDLTKNNDDYCSLDHHGAFNSNSAETTLDSINSSIEQAYSFLKDAHTLVLSFGTSYVYRLKSNDKVVANCHRLKAQLFKRELIFTPDFLKLYQKLFAELKSFNPKVQIILTVSPIRHLRDDFTENQVSKAQILSLSHLLKEKFEYCHYFPAYEIMMDDLRDYRFYKEDMVHPNQLAVDYIWQNFKNFIFSAKDQQYFDKMTKLSKRLKHKIKNPQDPKSIEYQKQTQELLIQLKKKYPFANWNTLS